MDFEGRARHSSSEGYKLVPHLGLGGVSTTAALMVNIIKFDSPINTSGARYHKVTTFGKAKNGLKNGLCGSL